MNSELDRRTFLSRSIAVSAVGTVAGAAGVASGTLTSPASTASTRVEKKPAHNQDAQRNQHSRTVLRSLKIGMIQEGATILEKFAAAKNAGFDGVELDSPGDFTIADVRAAMEKTGVRVPGVVNSTHWAKPFSHPDATVSAEMRESLTQSIRDCAAVGGTTVLLVPAVVSKEVSYEDAWDRSRQEIARVLPIAEEHNVAIAIENVWNNFLLGPIEARTYIDSFASDAIGWYMDIGNIVNYGWPEQWIRTLGRRVMKVDVKPFCRSRADAEGKWKGFGVGIGQEKDDTQPFADEADWPAVMRALDEVGYGIEADRAGWYSAEVGGGDSERLRIIAERMSAVLRL